MNKIFIFLLIASIISVTNGFQYRISRSFHSRKLNAFKNDETSNEIPSIPTNNLIRSRSTLNNFLTTGVAILSSQLLIPALQAKAVEVTKSSPIVVLGSGGKTGKLIVENLSKANIPVRATYRNKDFESADSVYADVTKIDSLGPAIEGASVVVFAASASNKGGNAEQVDYLGVKNVASECARLKVPRLIIISSGALTQPDTLAFKFTNLFGGILDWKLKGENSLRDIYTSTGDKSLSYVIIRPGGLGDYDAEGPSKVELNQGDTISGEVSRADVAETVIAAALSKTIPSRVIFEMYQTDRRGPLKGSYPKLSGFEQKGNNYDEMFANLKSDSF